MRNFLYICGAALIFFLCFKYSEYYCQQRFTAAPSVVYARDGAGLFLYDSLKQFTKEIFTSASSDECFFPAELAVHNDKVIFGTYKKDAQPDAAKETSTKEYRMVDVNGGDPSPYSVIQLMKPQDNSPEITVKENFKQTSMYSFFENFPKEFHLTNTARRENSQLECLFNQWNDQCVFIGPAERGMADKVIYLWKFKGNSLERIIDFPQVRMPLKDGGGGFLFPSFMNDEEIVYLEVPEQTIPVSMIGLNQFRESVLKKANLVTSQITTLTQFDRALNDPKVSPDGKFVVFSSPKDILADKDKDQEKNGEIWIEEISSGKKIKIGTGHSPVWAR